MLRSPFCYSKRVFFVFLHQILDMRYLVVFTVFIFMSCASNAPVTEVKAPIDGANIEAVLAYLTSDELQGRETGTEGNRKAASYLAERLALYGIEPFFTSYQDTLKDVPDTWNVVGLIPGTDPILKEEYVLLGAHYDHIGIQPSVDGDSIANGANDDATGVAIVAELARNLVKKSPKRSVLIAFFTGEEKGLWGSKHLANRLKSQNLNVTLMLNFEMLGIPMQREYMTYFTGANQSNIAEQINVLAGMPLVGVLEKAEEYQLFKRSDNYPFYQTFKTPSHSFSSFDFENFDYYHHVKDEFQLMDLKFMEDFTIKVAPVVEQLINLPSGTLKQY